jgi:hypothetical protein
MSTATPRRLDRRPTRSVPVGLLGLLLLAGGLLGAWLLGSLLVDGAWPEAARARLQVIGGLRLDSAPVLVAAGVLAALALVLLLAALLPGRSSRLPVLEDEVPGQTVVPRRDLARRAALRAERVDGVHSARADVSGRRLDVLVRTVVDDPEPVLRAARAAVQDSVDELRPTAALRTRVRIRRMS